MRLTPQGVGVDAASVVAAREGRVPPPPRDRDRHAASGGLPRGAPLGGRLDPVRDRVADELDERPLHDAEHVRVEADLPTSRRELHRLPLLVRRVARGPLERREEGARRREAHLLGGLVGLLELLLQPVEARRQRLLHVRRGDLDRARRVRLVAAASRGTRAGRRGASASVARARGRRRRGVRSGARARLADPSSSASMAATSACRRASSGKSGRGSRVALRRRGGTPARAGPSSPGAPPSRGARAWRWPRRSRRGEAGLLHARGSARVSEPGAAPAPPRSRGRDRRWRVASRRARP